MAFWAVKIKFSWFPSRALPWTYSKEGNQSSRRPKLHSTLLFFTNQFWKVNSNPVDVFIVNFDHISHLVPVFLLLTLKGNCRVTYLEHIWCLPWIPKKVLNWKGVVWVFSLIALSLAGISSLWLILWPFV